MVSVSSFLAKSMVRRMLSRVSPGTEFYDYVKKNGLITIDSMTDETGHQLPNVVYPGLDRGELVEFVERFYGEYFFRPRVVWRIVRKLSLIHISEPTRLGM